MFKIKDINKFLKILIILNLFGFIQFSFIACYIFFFMSGFYYIDYSIYCITFIILGIIAFINCFLLSNHNYLSLRLTISYILIYSFLLICGFLFFIFIEFIFGYEAYSSDYIRHLGGILAILILRANILSISIKIIFDLYPPNIIQFAIISFMQSLVLILVMILLFQNRNEIKDFLEEKEKKI